MDNESALVIISIAFGTILYILTLLKAPKVKFVNNTTHVDKARLPTLLKFLLFVLIGSIPIGYAIARDSTLVLQFIGLNLLVGAIMGSNLILLRERTTPKK